MIQQSDLYQIGFITRAHGVRGEVSMTFTDDVWDRVDADYVFLKIDGLFVPFFFEEWRFRSDSAALLKFEGIDDKNAAEHLSACEVWFPKELTPEEAPEEELTWKVFTGFEVIDEQTQVLLGSVTDVDDSTANVLLTITTPNDNELMVPAHETFIKRADHKQRRLYVDIPDEILHLNE